jgi:trimeric autotransporter adhesin
MSGPGGDFGSAQGNAGPPARRDPLILDLDGDGIQTTNVKASAFFDHDRNGFAEQTGWVNPHDGLLVMDRNGNGIIDNGSELFGGHTLLKDGTRAADGFQALAELDTNHDGKIDANDPAFSQLRVWKDLNGYGYSQPDQLFTLDELGIKAINLNSTMTNVTDAQGNTQTRLGSFEWADGTTGEIGQYNLQTGTTYTIPTQWLAQWLEIPDDMAVLPDLQGYGVVYDLQQAMVRDTSGHLKSLVEQFVNTTDPSSLDALMEQILFNWTGSDGIDPNSRGPNIDARKLSVLENFFGQRFVGTNGPNPTAAASILLNESYHKVFEIMEGRLMAFTHLSDLYSKISYTWDSE